MEYVQKLATSAGRFGSRGLQPVSRETRVQEVPATGLLLANEGAPNKRGTMQMKGEGKEVGNDLGLRASSVEQVRLGVEHKNELMMLAAQADGNDKCRITGKHRNRDKNILSMI